MRSKKVEETKSKKKRAGPDVTLRCHQSRSKRGSEKRGQVKNTIRVRSGEGKETQSELGLS